MARRVLNWRPTFCLALSLVFLAGNSALAQSTADSAAEANVAFHNFQMPALGAIETGAGPAVAGSEPNSAIANTAHAAEGTGVLLAPAPSTEQAVDAAASAEASANEPVNAAPAVEDAQAMFVAPVPAPVPMGSVAQPVESPKEALQLFGKVDQSSGVIVVDNDEAKDIAIVQESYQWEEIPDAAGNTKITAGASFPVRVVSSHNSKTAKVGDPVEAQLKVDIKIGGKLIAPKGARVVGHVSSCAPARRILHAELSKNRWMRANGMVGLQFDEIIHPHTNEHLPLVAKPARMARIVDNKNEGRVLGVNHKGEVATPLSIQLKHQALHLAIRGAASAGGVFSMGAVPVAYGVIGAINPSFAFLHPVGKNVPHRRLKGFAMGFVSGVPGGFLIADSIIKGQEAAIKPGDEFLVEFKQTFTGEAASDAELMPGAKTKVQGEVLKQDGKEPKPASKHK